MVPFLQSSFLRLPHVRHGFFTREGGVSSGYLSSLNCNQKHDDMENVLENRRRVVETLGGKYWVGVDQKHTNQVIFVDSLPKESVVADAIVTMTPGLVISVLTADCAPILLIDREKSIAAAVHAGWQGAFSGVIENTVTLMREKGATEILAAIGPCIHSQSYEVGKEFEGHFKESEVSNHTRFEEIFSENDQGTLQFNLPHMVYKILKNLGIEAEPSQYNTYSDEEKFFSYRRKTHRNEPPQGGQASSICLFGLRGCRAALSKGWLVKSAKFS